jgi:hypothetical protein
VYAAVHVTTSSIVNIEPDIGIDTQMDIANLYAAVVVERKHVTTVINS